MTDTVTENTYFFPNGGGWENLDCPNSQGPSLRNTIVIADGCTDLPGPALAQVTHRKKLEEGYPGTHVLSLASKTC